jgi:hypothetical protein
MLPRFWIANSASMNNLRELVWRAVLKPQGGARVGVEEEEEEIFAHRLLLTCPLPQRGF